VGYVNSLGGILHPFAVWPPVVAVREPTHFGLGVAASSTPKSHVTPGQLDGSTVLGPFFGVGKKNKKKQGNWRIFGKLNVKIVLWPLFLVMTHFFMQTLNSKPQA